MSKKGKAGTSSKSECVQVCVRLRPMSGDEKQDGRNQCCFVDSSRGEVSVVAPGTAGDGEGKRRFTYDYAFPPTITQEEVYDRTARPIVESVLEGYNGTVFAYGQTGTGKTWTMEGQPDVEESKGVIPRSFEQLFSTIMARKDKTQFLVRGSFLEIYQNNIFDLLVDHKEGDHGLPLKERKDGNNISVYAKGLTTTICKSPGQLMKLLRQGSKRRATASTQMNRSSSRSHCIFCCIVEQCPKSDPSAIRVGKLNMVDLAGSERAKKTGASGSTLDEAKTINLSLSALGNVISALTVRRIQHVPYRNSKLTRLLQDSLGGNTKTTMIAAIGPADYNYDETISTLRFAKRAKAIKNKPTINVNPKDALLMEMQTEIEMLRAQLRQINAGGGGGGGGAIGVAGAPGLTASGRVRVVKEVVKRVVKKGVTPEEIQRARREAEERVRQHSALLQKRIEELKSSVDTTSRKKRELDERVARVDSELNTKQQMREGIVTKLKAIQGQLAVGEKLKVQVEKDRLAAARKSDIVKRKIREERKMRSALKQKEDANLQLAQRYSSQAEELKDKSRKLDKLRSMYKEIALEIEDVQAENQHERSEMLQTIREMTRALKLKDLILDNFVPRQQLRTFSKRCFWDAAADSWKLREFDTKEGGVLQRPGSLKPGQRRPTTEFTRLSALNGDGNARFRARDIMQMELIQPKRTTQDYVGEGEEPLDEDEFHEDGEYAGGGDFVDGEGGYVDGGGGYIDNGGGYVDDGGGLVDDGGYDRYDGPYSGGGGAVYR